MSSETERDWFKALIAHYETLPEFVSGMQKLERGEFAKTASYDELMAITLHAIARGQIEKTKERSCPNCGHKIE